VTVSKIYYRPLLVYGNQNVKHAKFQVSLKSHCKIAKCTKLVVIIDEIIIRWDILNFAQEKVWKKSW